MAARTLALTILATEYASEIISQINRTAMALRVIPMVVGGGPNVSWVAKGSGATAAPMADGAAAGTATHDEQQGATLPWAYYKSDGEVTGPAQAAAATAASPRGNADRLAGDIVDSLAALASQINGHAYSGDETASPAQVGGLDRAIGNATIAYAGIDRSSKTWFAPKVFNPGVDTTVTQAQIRKDLTQIADAGGRGKPDLGLCHSDVFETIANTFDSNRRFVQEITVDRRGRIVLDASVDAVVIGGCTFIPDKDATLESGSTSGRIYYLNTRHVEWVILPQPEIAGFLREMGVAPGMVLRANDGFGPVPLLAAVVAMAKAGDSDKFMSKTYLQLRARQPSACGMRRFAKID